MHFCLFGDNPADSVNQGRDKIDQFLLFFCLSAPFESITDLGRSSHYEPSDVDIPLSMLRNFSLV